MEPTFTCPLVVFEDIIKKLPDEMFIKYKNQYIIFHIFNVGVNIIRYYTVTGNGYSTVIYFAQMPSLFDMPMFKNDPVDEC